MNHVHCRAQASDQSLISIAIFLKCLLSFLEKFQDRLGKIRPFKGGSERVPGEVYTSYFGVVG